jgi:hypothetical protein
LSQTDFRKNKDLQTLKDTQIKSVSAKQPKDDQIEQQKSTDTSDPNAKFYFNNFEKPAKMSSNKPSDEA